MWTSLKVTVLVLLAFTSPSYTQEDNYIFETDLITETTVLPTLANGHIGFQIFGEALLLNSLYNGEQGNSHRARIENFANIQMKTCFVEILEDLQEAPNYKFTSPPNCNYRLNAREGFFEVVYDQPEFHVTHRVYAHRFYNRAVVNQFVIKRKLDATENPIPGLIEIELVQTTGGPYENVTLTADDSVTVNDVIYTKYIGQTKYKEHPDYQQDPRDFFIYSRSLADTEKIVLTDDGVTSAQFDYYLTADFTEESAKNELDAIAALTSADIELKHTTEWDTIWKRIGITIEGDDELAKAIHTSQFFLAASLPSLATNQPSNPFYGLAPAGLGRGGKLLAEYQGHSFWDTEMWMHPPILLLEPKWSEEILNYRFSVRQAAYDNAKNTQFEGLRFPWESGYTGCEVTPECCPEVVEYQLHITADIAFAVRSHLYVTHDMDWFRSQGCELAVQTAKFWASKVEFNETTDVYEIFNVMGPDEDHHGINNNAFTNVIAGYNLFFGEFASCVCKTVLNMPDYEVINEWSAIAKKLKLGYDSKKDYHPQYEGYTDDTAIKQADTVLLGFPLQYPMDASTKLNNLVIYDNLTRENGPAMTWAMHVIGFLDIDDNESASQVFVRSYRDYIRKPFQVWSEVTPEFVGAGNFITGAGGFLQTIINGYGGIRLNIDELSVSHMRLPSKITKMTFNGISYLGHRFSLEIAEKLTKLTFNTENADIPLLVTVNGEMMCATLAGCELTLDLDDKVLMKASTYAFGNCEMPVNTIKTVDINATGTIGISAMLTLFCAFAGYLFNHF